MLLNYIKIAWRNLIRNKTYSFINITGLSVGIASCLLIFLFIRDELSLDRFNKKADRIYQIYRHTEREKGPADELLTTGTLGPALIKEIPGIKNAVRINRHWKEVKVEKEDKAFYENNFFFTDPSLFDVFSFKLLKGNPETVLNRPYTVVLSREMARKYFGEDNPLGQTLTITGLWGPHTYEVTGVLQNTHYNAHFHIHFLTALKTYFADFPGPERIAENMEGYYTYALLRKGIKPADIAEKVQRLDAASQKRNPALSYRFQPLTRIHLYSHFQREIEPNSDVQYLYIFGSIAILVLIIAGINYMNMATARSMERVKEVGVRKPLGSVRIRLIGQFLSESLLFCFLSLISALLIVKLSLPYFNNWTGKSMHLPFADPVLWASSIIVLLLIGLLAGGYPAFVLSRFRPHRVFSGAVAGRKKSMLRNGLVVFQFAVSVFLITGTLVISNQLDYLRTMQLGLDSQHVVSVFTGPGAGFKKKLPGF